eukprot:7531001-Pyramimonas_sp.AAC.1
MPPRLDVDGAFRERSERSIWLNMAPRGPQGAQDDLLDGSRWPKMAQDGFQYAPRGPKIAPRPFQEAEELPKEALKRPKSFNNLKKIIDCCFLAFSLPMAFRGLKMASRWP